MLYWAYGSNLCVQQMRRRCPRAQQLRPLHMTEAKLVFRGVADVTLTRNSITPGGLWKITGECEKILDQYEGAGKGSGSLYVKRYIPVLQDGRKQDCMFYLMKTHRGIQPPSENYISIIEQGYNDFGLDLAYLNEALEDAWGRKEITPMLRERYERKGRPKLARI